MQVFSIQNQSEKNTLAGNAKNMIQNASSPISVMQTNFQNRVHPAVPNQPAKDKFVFVAVVSEVDTNWNRNFLEHNLNIPKYNPKSRSNLGPNCGGLSCLSIVAVSG